MKTKGSGRSCFVRHVKLGASLANSGIQWDDKGIILGPPRKKTNCSTGSRKPIILKIRPDREEKLEEIDR
jgi:hypothetical protein